MNCLRTTWEGLNATSWIPVSPLQGLMDSSSIRPRNLHLLRPIEDSDIDHLGITPQKAFLNIFPYRWPTDT